MSIKASGKENSSSHLRGAFCVASTCMVHSPQDVESTASQPASQLPGPHLHSVGTRYVIAVCRRLEKGRGKGTM